MTKSGRLKDAWALAPVDGADADDRLGAGTAAAGACDGASDEGGEAVDRRAAQGEAGPDTGSGTYSAIRAQRRSSCCRPHQSR